MKCPYAVNRITQSKTEFEYDSENIEIGQCTTEINKAEFLDCLEENCGAYNKKQKFVNTTNKERSNCFSLFLYPFIGLAYREIYFNSVAAYAEGKDVQL